MLIYFCQHLSEEGNGTPLQYSCLEDSMDGGAWKAAVHDVSEGWEGVLEGCGLGREALEES